jgi:hypothetical protein
VIHIYETGSAPGPEGEALPFMNAEAPVDLGRFSLESTGKALVFKNDSITFS